MKRPYLTQEQRLFLKWHRSGEYKTTIGAFIEFDLANKKLQREICKIFKKIIK